MGEGCPNLIDLIQKSTQFMANNNNRDDDDDDEDENIHLELRLALPGDGDEQQRWSNQKKPVRERTIECYVNSQILSLNSFSSPKLGFPSIQWLQQQIMPNESLQPSLRGISGVVESSPPQLCCSRMVELQNSPVTANTAVHNTCQKRSAPAAVVGWPPVRSFRKNIASTSSSKPVAEPHSSIQSKPLNEKRVAEKSNKGMFVKINMDGVPIGRKVDLNAYDSYEKLSSSVDALFRGLLAAQRDSSDEGDEKEEEEHKPMIGLLDGSGEYTLVYEDKDGDRMLVGDVPWDMFLSTVKRLRVLKTSDLPTLCRLGLRKTMSR